MAAAGDTWLVLGGTGFIGRNFVKHLLDNKLAGKIVVADKTMPAVANMMSAHKACFENKDMVTFKQSDLAKDAHVERVFKEAKYDYVVNLCGETRFGMTAKDYEVKCTNTAAKVAPAAKAQGVKKWVEVSTAQVYKPDKKLSTEKSEIAPWTGVAVARLAAEKAVQASGVPAVVLRPAYVYGSGDMSSLTPRATCAAVYQMRKEKMKFLWDKKLLLNVVHVEDVVRAIVAAAKQGKAGSVYNLADESCLSQGVLNEYLANLFGIKTGFMGNMVSAGVVKVGLNFVAESSNDKHVPGWAKLCQEHKILNTPLSPYIDKELLKNQNLSVDGSAITKDLDFKYSVPKISEAKLKEQLVEFVKEKQFPPVL